MELEKIRQEIDSIDKELVRLLERRMHCVEDVIRYKETHQNPVLDRAREEEVLANVASLVQEKRYEETILPLTGFEKRSEATSRSVSAG